MDVSFLGNYLEYLVIVFMCLSACLSEFMGIICVQEPTEPEEGN